MKKIAIFLTIIISILICGCKEGTTNNETVQVAVEGIPIDEDNFPDEYFRDYLEKNVDKDFDGYISEDEKKNTITISFDASNTEYEPIENVTGIELFCNLDTLCFLNTSLKKNRC